MAAGAVSLLGGGPGNHWVLPLRPLTSGVTKEMTQPQFRLCQPLLHPVLKALPALAPVNLSALISTTLSLAHLIPIL